MTQQINVLKENPYFCHYQFFSTENSEKQEVPFYFKLYPLNFDQQVVIFSKRLPDSSLSTPQKVQDMATIALKELLLNPNEVIWIEKYLYSFDQKQPVFYRILLEWQNDQAINPKWIPILEDWNLLWLENLAVKTVVLNKN